MRKLIPVCILVLFALPVMADTYSWTDERGTVNFTEDYGKIPKKYRKKARRIGDDAPPPVETTEAPRGQKGSPVVDPRAEQQPKPKQEKKTLYGGKEGAEWSKEFGRMRADLKSAEDQLVDTRKQLNDTSKMSRNEYLSLQLTLKNMEKRVLDLRKRLEALDATANAAEVPADFRQ